MPREGVARIRSHVRLSVRFLFADHLGRAAHLDARLDHAAHPRHAPLDKTLVGDLWAEALSDPTSYRSQRRASRGPNHLLRGPGCEELVLILDPAQIIGGDPFLTEALAEGATGLRPQRLSPEQLRFGRLNRTPGEPLGLDVDRGGESLPAMGG